MLGDTLLDEWVEFGAQLVDTLPISLPEIGGAGAAASSAPSAPPRRGALSRRIIAEEEAEEEEAEAADDFTRALGRALAPPPTPRPNESVAERAARLAELGAARYKIKRKNSAAAAPATTTGLGWRVFGRIWADFGTEQRQPVTDDLLYPDQARCCAPHQPSPHISRTSAPHINPRH